MQKLIKIIFLDRKSREERTIIHPVNLEKWSIEEMFYFPEERYAEIFSKLIVRWGNLASLEICFKEKVISDRFKQAFLQWLANPTQQAILILHKDKIIHKEKEEPLYEDFFSSFEEKPVS